jgi:uncharacterized protein
LKPNPQSTHVPPAAGNGGGLVRPRSSPLARFSLVLVPVLLGAIALGLAAAEKLPPPPTRYFADFSGTIPAADADRFNTQLEEFERRSSSQVVVAVFPRMESGSSIEDYVHRLFQAWQIGQRQKNNGALLAVFLQDRAMRIEVGYGLEGAIPDAIAKRIIEERIVPEFRQANYVAGIQAGITGLLQAATGEFQGTGRTNADRGSGRGRGRGFPLGLLVVLLLVISAAAQRRRPRGTVFHRGGRGHYRGPWSGWGSWPSGGSGWGGGGWSGGGSGGFSGGGFSGGGGSSGGGGASGRW